MQKERKINKYRVTDPGDEELKFTEKFESVIKTIKKYEEGRPPRKLRDIFCYYENEKNK